jgi:hypothetical protein
MAPPVAMLAQQGAVAANLIVAKKSAGVLWREPSVGDNERAGRTRSEAASLASPNRCLSEHDARRHITQNRTTREYNHERDDLHNIIEDRRRLMLKKPSPS